MITSPAEVRGEAAKVVTGTKRDKQRIIFQATIQHLKPKQRNNFPASAALNRWTKPLQQQAGVFWGSENPLVHSHRAIIVDGSGVSKHRWPNPLL